MIKIYTDGSTRIENRRGAENEGGWGVVVYENDKIIDAMCAQVKNTTNNECELLAILWAVNKYGTSDEWNAPTIYSDSTYAINSITRWAANWEQNGWINSKKEPVANKLIIQGIRVLMSNGANVHFEKVKGHSDVEGNVIADKLATGVLKPEELMNDLDCKDQKNII